MKVSARLRYRHTSPRKARQVVNLIRGKSVPQALTILSGTERSAARIVEKLVCSAVANATANHEVQDVDELVVSEVCVDGGPTMKRWRPRARGRATPIHKRTSHIRVTLSDGADEQQG